MHLHMQVVYDAGKCVEECAGEGECEMKDGGERYGAKGSETRGACVSVCEYVSARACECA